MNEMQRVEQYVERYFQRHHMTAFPTVREVARAMGVKQADIEEIVDSHENLLLTYFHTDWSRVPLGDFFVETYGPPAALEAVGANTELSEEVER